MHERVARRRPCIPTVDPQPGIAEWHVERLESGVRLSGHLRTQDATTIVAAVREATTGAHQVEIDSAASEQIDGGVIALVRADLAHHGVHADLRGGSRFRPLIELYTNGTTAPPPRPRRTPERLVAHVGRATVEDVAAVEESVGFVGEMTVAVGRLVRARAAATGRRSLPSFERAGPDALPIVLTINFLVGLVIAYMSARELKHVRGEHLRGRSASASRWRASSGR